ncbi:DUF2235 domain-containing protein [Dokdonella sp.]|uniref:DUF2235 domain-containing protein n=1 Tax=Dokdonella sp. TaxID=2291710 RepID=UPI003C6A4678
MKRIVVCADGTWNVRDQLDEETGKRRPTNVTKLARAVLPRGGDGVDQVVFYDEGVGTSGGLDKVTGGAFGRGIERNVRDIYRFLSYNYEEGDEIYLFGFSRGAFTVRTLAGFMNRVGLLDKGDDYYVPDVYAAYETNESAGTARWEQIFHNVKVRRECPPIRMIGVWDTVGSLGAPGFLGRVVNRSKYKYHDIALNGHIHNAFHALAIDEQRKPFAPDLWKRPADWQGQLEQAWFAGVHSNIGGGYTPDGLANEALHWMVEKAEGLGLKFNAAYLNFFAPVFYSELKDSMTMTYRAMGRNIREIGAHHDAGEAVHQSAVDRTRDANSSYRPENLQRYLDSGRVRVVDTTRIERGRQP